RGPFAGLRARCRHKGRVALAEQRYSRIAGTKWRGQDDAHDDARDGDLAEGREAPPLWSRGSHTGRRQKGERTTGILAAEFLLRSTLHGPGVPGICRMD